MSIRDRLTNTFKAKTQVDIEAAQAGLDAALAEKTEVDIRCPAVIAEAMLRSDFATASAAEREQSAAAEKVRLWQTTLQVAKAQEAERLDEKRREERNSRVRSLDQTIAAHLRSVEQMQTALAAFCQSWETVIGTASRLHAALGHDDRRDFSEFLDTGDLRSWVQFESNRLQKHLGAHSLNPGDVYGPLQGHQGVVDRGTGRQTPMLDLFTRNLNSLKERIHRRRDQLNAGRPLSEQLDIRPDMPRGQRPLTPNEIHIREAEKKARAGLDFLASLEARRGVHASVQHRGPLRDSERGGVIVDLRGGNRQAFASAPEPLEPPPAPDAPEPSTGSPPEVSAVASLTDAELDAARAELQAQFEAASAAYVPPARHPGIGTVALALRRGRLPQGGGDAS